MPKNNTVVGKYVFLDIVHYSYGRTIEAQSDIIDAINSIVKSSVASVKIDKRNLIFIPTGDGMCIALLDIHDPFDLHMQLALKIMELLHKYNESQKDNTRKFKIRVGVNENTDNLITDINGNKNVAGAGITEAQRIMDQADGGNILVGRAVFNHLRQRERYINKFKEFSVTIKHREKMQVYQYVDPALEYLNSAAPSNLMMIDKFRKTGEQLKTTFSSVKSFSSMENLKGISKNISKNISDSSKTFSQKFMEKLKNGKREKETKEKMKRE